MAQAFNKEGPIIEGDASLYKNRSERNKNMVTEKEMAHSLWPTRIVGVVYHCAIVRTSRVKFFLPDAD